MTSTSIGLDHLTIIVVSVVVIVIIVMGLFVVAMACVP